MLETLDFIIRIDFIILFIFRFVSLLCLRSTLHFLPTRTYKAILHLSITIHNYYTQVYYLASGLEFNRRPLDL